MRLARPFVCNVGEETLRTVGHWQLILAAWSVRIEAGFGLEHSNLQNQLGRGPRRWRFKCNVRTPIRIVRMGFALHYLLGGGDEFLLASAGVGLRRGGGSYGYRLL